MLSGRVWAKLMATVVLVMGVSAFLGCQSEFRSSAKQAKPGPELLVVVMDPLAAPLSCPCVEGYAQRQYEALSEYLQQQLHVSVEVVFGDALSTALRERSVAQAGLIIGKDSVVQADAAKAGLALERVARLTDKRGVTTQRGLFVVRSDDPAQSLTDLAGYRMMLGPEDCDEKHAAARRLLAAAGINLPPELIEVSPACSDGACKLVDGGPDVRGAAVISSYAQPLLEGCGTIQAGDLRVVAETEPVAFISAFVAGPVDRELRAQIQQALLSVGEHPEVCAVGVAVGLCGRGDL